jgi:hypothetical protein
LLKRRTDEHAYAEQDGAEPEVEVQAEGDAGAAARFNFGHVFRVAAWLLFTATLVLLYLRHPEVAFLMATLGAAAWFLGVRTTLIRKHDLVKVGGRNWRPRREVEADGGEDVED